MDRQSNCKQCNKEFLSHSYSKRVFCSRNCYRLSRRHAIKEWSPCLICGGIKKIRSYKYCSRKCSGVAARGRKPWCDGKNLSEITKEKIRKAHIGKKCIKSEAGMKSFVEKMSGKNSHQWKGGITSFNKIERAKFRLHLQNKVLLRDNYTCQICGERGGDLQVDHIQPWKDYVELRFDLNNCRTLCMDCHYKITFGREKPKEVVWGHNLKHVIERMVK